MKLLSILKKDFLILVRNQADMAILFLMPLAFILPVSLALGSGDGYGITRNNRMIALPVVNYDRGARAQDLTASIGESLFLETFFTAQQISGLGLENEPDCAGIVNPKTATPETKITAVQTDDPTQSETPQAENIPAPATDATAKTSACYEKVSRMMLERSQRSAVLLIPEGFSQAVNAGKPAEVTLLYDPAGDPTRLQQIEGVIKGATIRLSIKTQVNSGMSQLNDLAVFAPDEIRQSLDQQFKQPAVTHQQPAVNLHKISPSKTRLNSMPDTFQQTIPGYTVMYVFFIITSMAGSIRQEKLSGTFRRLLSAPISRAELLGGKLLASLSVGLIQVFLLFLVGALVFNLGLGNDPVAFLVLTISLVLAAASLGLAISTTQLRGAGLAAPLIISALLGGCMFPLDLMPAFLRSISYIVPHSWALRGYQNLMVRGMGMQDILPQIGALLAFALVFFLLAVWRFRFDD